MSPKDFTCILCDSTKRETLPRWISQERSQRICDECAEESIVPLFRQAIEHEHAYPPRWGRQTLDFWTFQDLLDEEDKYRWRVRVREYRTRVEERVYCCHRDGESGEVCGAFLGEKGEGAAVCLACQSCTCRSCGVSWPRALGELDDHMCDSAREEDPLAGMAEGDDYQQCPSCKRKATQGEGCNHMVCACAAHFCFLCGKEVEARRSGHWQIGGCPRFGRVKNGTGGFFDQFGYYSDEEDDDNEEESDAAVALHFARRARLMARYESVRIFFSRQATAERRQIDNTAGRQNRSRTWTVDALARGNLYEAVASNLDLAQQLLDPTLEDEEAEAFLIEFVTRHNIILQSYRAARDMGQDDGDEVQISNMSLEFEMYFDAARITMDGPEAFHSNTIR